MKRNGQGRGRNCGGGGGVPLPDQGLGGVVRLLSGLVSGPLRPQEESEAPETVEVVRRRRPRPGRRETRVPGIGGPRLGIGRSGWTVGVPVEESTGVLEEGCGVGRQEPESQGG